MFNNILVEVCCGNINDVIIADKCHADRIELNCALESGGLTPSLATLITAKQYTNIPICCMVRTRNGGFCYSDAEFEVMKQEAKILLDNGADGIVFGFLKQDGTIDVERTKEMVEIVHPKEAVFHKAFDGSADLEVSINQLIDCGIDRILTSGGSSYSSLEEGVEKVKYLEEKHGDKITLLFGGGVKEENVQYILKTTKCRQIHMTAKHLKADESICHGEHLPLTEETQYIEVSEDNLLKIIDKINEL